MLLALFAFDVFNLFENGDTEYLAIWWNKFKKHKKQ